VIPRLAFLGVGWIGRARMEALARSGAAVVAAVSDTSAEAAGGAAGAVGGAPVVDWGDVLDGRVPVDGVVIATPSGQHAAQAETALEAGLAVFCQKPLGRDAVECRRVVEAARVADRLLGVDLSYRDATAVRAVVDAVDAGVIGAVYAAELVFHNAFGPAATWSTDPRQAGGGCAIDLGIHLVDLALTATGWPHVERVDAQRFAAGRRLSASCPTVEDHAVVRLDLATGAVATIACSWHAHAGADAEIRATVRGERGTLELRNRDGSFYDFEAWRFHGNRSELLVGPPDDWPGRTAVGWARRLADDPGFDKSVEDQVVLASVLDRVYGR
jgi:predicted dehydrogenase